MTGPAPAAPFRAAVFQYRFRDEDPGNRLSRLERALLGPVGDQD